MTADTGSLGLARPANEPTLGADPAPERASAAGIASRIQRSILDGEYHYGERLPAERDLATRFSASRSTVREALRRLEAMQLVSRHVGSGTYVRHRDQADVAEITSPLELIEVRITIEPQMARLAVVHASERDLEQLGLALRRVEACQGDGERFSRADEDFHLALAESTGNPLLVWVYRYVNAVRAHRQWDARKDKILTAPRIAAYNQQHRELYEAIRARDAEAAGTILREHLEQARRDLVGVESA
jgi:DNA-binding FadR family transcriptional regulator